MKSRGLLLDRDGVINVDHGYVGRREDFEFIPAVFPFLRAAQDRGYRMAVLTNQAGVARGFYTAQDHENLTKWMLQKIAKQGVAIELVLTCFEHSEGKVAEYRRETYWRKPYPGMVLEAVQRLQLDPTRTAFIGDHIRDMQAGVAGGIAKNLWLHGDIKIAPKGVTVVKDYDEALKALDV